MMFETRITIPKSKAGSGGRALRAFGWSELTARINAARDLRLLMLNDGPLLTASFDDAAAGYFAQSGQGKRYVNHDALGGRKCSDGTEKFAEGYASTGDREK